MTKYQQREMARLETALAEWRATNQRPTPIPANIWSGAAKLTEQLGVSEVAQVLRLDSGQAETDGRRNRLDQEVVTSGHVHQSPGYPVYGSCRHVVLRSRGRVGRRRSDESPLGWCQPHRPRHGFPAVRELRMLQITPHMRILVAVEPVDGRKGIDGLSRLCRQELDEDPGTHEVGTRGRSSFSSTGAAPRSRYC